MSKIAQNNDIFKKRKAILVFSILFSVVLVCVLLSYLLFPVIRITGDYNAPFLQNGDIVVLIKDRTPEKGDVVALSWQNKILVRRVIATQGDYIRIDDEGNVYVNDVILDEPYVTGKCLGDCDLSFPYQVPQDHYFLLGDNRESSVDSRNSVFGVMTGENIIGRYLFCIG